MKKVLITGGTGGIGRALISLFVKEGYQVCYTYHTQKTEHPELQDAQGYYCDLASDASIKELCMNIKNEGNCPDILINNAGVGHFTLFQDLSYEDWTVIRHVNLDAPMALTKEFLPDMISRKWGRILNISSMWGQVGASCEVGYSTAKAGLIGFTKALAKEVGPSGITVNCIAPGLIDTPMNRNLSEDAIHALISETPVCRMGTPEDVSEMCLFLAKEKASFITGQVIGVNGGFVIT